MDGLVREPTLPGVFFHLLDVAAEGPSAERRAEEVLDTAERARGDAFRDARDRRCYQVAHVALRLLLGALMDRPPAGIVFGRSACSVCGGPAGRPVIEDGGPEFSLSHTRNWVVVAVSDLPLGVDVEAVPSPEVTAELAASLSARERAELITVPDDEAPLALARAWTRKEACGKAMGTGLAHGALQRYVGAGSHPAEDVPGMRVFDLPAPQGHVAALATSLATRTVS